MTEQSGVMSAREFAISWAGYATLIPELQAAIEQRDSQIRAERDAEVMELVECLEKVGELLPKVKTNDGTSTEILFHLENLVFKHTKPKGK